MSAKPILWCAIIAASLTTLFLAARPGGAAPAAANGGAPAAPPVGGRAGGRGAGAPANTGGAMRDMEAMVQAFKRDAADPEKIDQTLKNLAQFERDVAIAKMQNPPSTVGLSEAVQKSGATDYRNAMTTLQRAALDLEDAVIAKKVDDIKKLIKVLDDTENVGHHEFKVGM